MVERSTVHPTVVSLTNRRLYDIDYGYSSHSTYIYTHRYVCIYIHIHAIVYRIPHLMILLAFNVQVSVERQSILSLKCQQGDEAL